MIADSPWLVRPRPRPHARVRLFCFPFAGGSSFTYRAWADALPPSIEVAAIRLPGRESRRGEAAYRRVGSLVDALAAALPPFFDRPFAFFGHSMGALVAYELARALPAPPAHLFVSGRRAPDHPDPRAPIHALADAPFVAELRHLNGTPEDVLRHAELLELVLPVLRADFELCETHAHADGPPLPCPLTAMGGVADARVPRATLEAWRAQTTSAFALRMFPGDHFYLEAARPAVLSAIVEAVGA
jgi:medium-chain acyl-[acyl-carrier-protein] hydrolase